MIKIFDYFKSFFDYKKRVKYFIERNPSMGFYYSRDGKIGDAYGPMNAYRYMSEKDFYLLWKDSIDYEWRSRTKQRSKGTEKR